MSKKAKTHGYEWLYLSLMAFNGSGYADYRSPEAYLQSYIDYKHWKRKQEAVALAREYEAEALDAITNLLPHAQRAGRVPSSRQMNAFNASKNGVQLWHGKTGY